MGESTPPAESWAWLQRIVRGCVKRRRLPAAAGARAAPHRGAGRGGRRGRRPRTPPPTPTAGPPSTRRRWPTRSSPASLPAARLRRSRMTLLRTAATDASDARALATAQAEQAELVRAQWTAAAQRTKGLEKLRERHQAALQHAEDAAEERAVDDLVTGRAGRRDRRRGGPVDGVTAGPGPDQRDPVPLPLPRRRRRRRRLGERRRGGRADRHQRDLVAARLGRRRPRRAPSSPRRRSTSASPTSGAAPTRRRAWTARASPSSSTATSASTCRAPPRSRPPPGTAGRLARRRPPRRPGLLRLLLVARRDRPRRHLHRQRQDDRRPAGGRVGQGAGRRQPDGHPPGAARADDGDGAAAGGAALAGVPYADLFSRAASRYGVDASLLAAMASRSRASTPRRSPPPGAQGLMQFMPATAKGLGRQPARPDLGDRRRRPLPQQPDQAVRLHRPGPGRLQRRARHGQPLRRDPALLRDPELRPQRDEQGGGLPMSITRDHRPHPRCVRVRARRRPPAAARGAVAVRLAAGRRPVHRPAAGRGRPTAASSGAAPRRSGRPAPTTGPTGPPTAPRTDAADRADRAADRAAHRAERAAAHAAQRAAERRRRRRRRRRRTTPPSTAPPSTPRRPRPPADRGHRPRPPTPSPGCRRPSGRC